MGVPLVIIQFKEMFPEQITIQPLGVNPHGSRAPPRSQDRTIWMWPKTTSIRCRFGSWTDITWVCLKTWCRLITIDSSFSLLNEIEYVAFEGTHHFQTDPCSCSKKSFPLPIRLPCVGSQRHRTWTSPHLLHPPWSIIRNPTPSFSVQLSQKFTRFTPWFPT